MRLRDLFLPLMFCSAASSHAGPSFSEMRALFAFRIGMACIQQEPELRGLPIARSWGEARPDFPGWDAVAERPLGRCLSTRLWIDKSLCREVMEALDVASSSDRATGTRALNAALDRHADALAVADDVLYVEDDAHQNPNAFVCPVTPSKRSALYRARAASAPTQ